MKRVILTLTILILLAVPLAATAAQPGQTYAVSVTNLTKGQIISPPVVAAHNGEFSLFETGAASSPELAALAEDAVSGPLMALLGADPNVGDVTIGDGPILPGHTATIYVTVNGRNARITAVGMLVTTNDTFFAVRGAAAPRSRFGAGTHRSPGYDAGSEDNNESCAYIPGPPCGSAGARTETSEGFIYIQNGVHGIGDLAPSESDWRNPVAEVTIRRAN